MKYKLFNYQKDINKRKRTKRKKHKEYLINKEERIIKLRNLPYKEYLISSYWNTFKKKVYCEYGRQCFRCLNKHNLQIHHTSYLNRGDPDKEIYDVIILCDKCHKEEHNI